MAKKKKGFDISTFMDKESLDILMEKGGTLAPTEEEVKHITESSGHVEDIPVSMLKEYKHHTFRVLDDEDMAALVDSIRINGVVLPLTVRKLDSEHYEIIAGHRRTRAATILGLETVPCLVEDMDDATAAIVSVDTNLHRKEIRPSDKARSYELRVNAMKEKGFSDTGSESAYTAEFAKEIKSSRANVMRYRKLLKLTPALLDLVDRKEIPVNAGAALADVPQEEQKFIEEALKEAKKPLTIEAAEKIATASRNGLTTEKVLAILAGDFKPRKKKTPKDSTSIKEKNIKAYYPAGVKSLSGSDKEAFIADCIKAYIENHDTWNGILLK